MRDSLWIRKIRSDVVPVLLRVRIRSDSPLEKRGMQVNYRIDSEAHPIPIWIPAADRLEPAGCPMPVKNPVCNIQRISSTFL